MNNRREFFKKGGALGLSVLVSKFVNAEKLNLIDKIASLNEHKFVLPELPYAYDALEPFIDKQTMEIHHKKHHQAYIDKLNSAPAGEIDHSLNDASKCAKIDKNSSMLIRNNLGGYYNHCLFWQLLRPNPAAKENLPQGKLAQNINADFRSFDEFKKEFTEKASKIFGSGWCWLISQNGKLKIVTTPNQDNPLMNLDGEKGNIILALDVWEHAYYLKYQNKRIDYINNWWNIVNWEKALELHSK